MSFWDSEEVLGEIDKGDERIFVKRVTKGKRAYIDVRTFWLGDDDEWKPSKKGIAIPLELAEDVAQAILEGSREEG